MSHVPDPQVELEQLLVVMNDGTLSDEQDARIAELVAGDPQLCRYYLERVFVYGKLRRLMNSSAFSAELEAAGVVGSTSSVALKIEVKPASLSRRSKRFDSIHPQRHKIRFNAMTAVLTALAWIGFSYFVWFSTTPDGFRPNHTGSIQYVAEITGQHEHRWAEGMPPMFVRHALLSGERLDLAEGLVEITFDDGAVVVLEGPTDFVVDSSEAGTLDNGKLVADVPQEAIGFTVHTPTGRVVDLGTQFGLSVNEAGAAEVHVFDGEVEAIHLDPFGKEVQRISLVENEAARIGPEDVAVVRIAAHVEPFEQLLAAEPGLRSVTDLARGLIAHYEFEDGPGSTTAADSSGNGHTGTLEGNATIINDAERGNVFFGELYNGTLGEGTGMDIDNTVAIPTLVAASSTNRGMTLAAWVKLSSTNAGFDNTAFVVGMGNGGTNTPLISLGLTAEGAVSGYIDGDVDPNDQIVVTGSDGAVTEEVWTHIAITYDRFTDDAIVYVNGVQSGSDVDISGVNDGELNWATAAVGRWAQSTDKLTRNFPGLIDDARIYGGVLTALEIQSLFTSGIGVSVDVDTDALSSD